ncbi:hypothetical protein C8N25_108106 [Algoriphagus antarcticus]|uniref:Uncharacterized protein n=1 Tax=Algoriphagus antarcticus TaxID=238540 RepID=A0A3E0DVM4_9BACT|nr:hypothetical protein C8N25_108106 [Algoriphagus antarcticus]
MEYEREWTSVALFPSKADSKNSLFEICNLEYLSSDLKSKQIPSWLCNLSSLPVDKDAIRDASFRFGVAFSPQLIFIRSKTQNSHSLYYPRVETWVFKCAEPMVLLLFSNFTALHLQSSSPIAFPQTPFLLRASWQFP